MKKQLYVISFFVLFAGCGSKEKNSSGVNHPEAPSISRETAEVVFKRNQKDLANLSVEDTESGIAAIFKSSKLEKGQYILKIEEACKIPSRSKTELPRKMFKSELGQFKTNSGFTMSEFAKPGLSIGYNYMSIRDKAVSLYKKGQKGNLTKVSCAKIETR